MTKTSSPLQKYTSMFEIFKEYITQKAVLTVDDLDLIQSVSVVKKLRKRQYLLQEGDISRSNAFVARGCLRLYRINDTGAEHVLRFAKENWWMSDRESYLTGEPSKSYIDALEDTYLITWSKENWEKLKAAIPTLKAFEEELLARSFVASQNRIHATISLSSEEKYNHFASEFPDLLNRVPQQMVASYLGISRETLSRIRSQHICKPSNCPSKAISKE